MPIRPIVRHGTPAAFGSTSITPSRGMIRRTLGANWPMQTPNTAAIWLSYGSDVTNVSEAVGINDLTIEKNIVYDWYSALGLNAGLVPGGVGATALNGLAYMHRVSGD